MARADGDAFGFVVGDSGAVGDFVDGLCEGIEDAAVEVMPGTLLGDWVSEERIDEALDITRCECATDEVERLFVGMGWGGDNDQKNRHDKPRSVAIGSLQYSGLQAVWSSIRACMV